MRVYVITMREEYEGIGYSSGLRVFANKEDMLKAREEYKDYAIGQFEGEDVEIDDNIEEGYLQVSLTDDMYINIYTYEAELE